MSQRPVLSRRPRSRLLSCTEDEQSPDSIDHYLAALERIPVLPADTQIALARQMRAGDPDARAALIEGNLRFAFSIAKRYQHRGLPLADLINEANTGLCVAADKFDPDAGVRFISYAVWWIRQAILSAIAKHGRLMRVPLSRTADLHRVSRAAELLRQKLGREPTANEIATVCDLNAAVVAELRTLLVPIHSLDAPLGDDGRDRPLSHYLATPVPEDVTGDLDVDLERRARCEDVARALGRLRPRDALIVRLYFGFEDDREHTLEEIGARLGITRERVRQIRDRALQELQTGVARRLLADHANAPDGDGRRPRRSVVVRGPEPQRDRLRLRAGVGREAAAVGAPASGTLAVATA